MRPEALRHRAIDPAAVRAGMTVPAGKSRERATGVQKPVVSEGMTRIPKQNQVLADQVPHRRRGNSAATLSGLHNYFALATLSK
jgi:hypothetical protein